MMLPWQRRPRDLNSPRDLPNLQLWTDAKDTGSIVTDTGIKLWADKSGNSSTNVLCLNGVAGNYASTPNIAYPSTEFEAEVGLSCPDWTPAGNSVIWGKDDGASARIARMILVTNGTIQLQLSVNGTAFTTANSSASVPFSDYSFGYIKATWRASDGRVQFFTSTDGTTFSQLGTDQTLAIASIFNASRITEIGSVVSGASSNLNGNVGYVTLRSSIGGSNFLNFRASVASKLATSVTGVGTGETWTINTSGATGARISGARDLYQGTAANQPIYLPHSGTNYGYLNGVSGNYFSTPDSAALSITGDIDVRARATLPTWTPAATSMFFSKAQNAGQRSYDFYTDSTGNLYFRSSTDGTALGTVASSVATGFSANSTNWVRATRASVSGTTTFYTSSDGTNWTQLGTTVASTAGNLFDGTDALNIGCQTTAAFLLTGNLLRVQIYNGIAGTIAFDFNPAAYTSGTTFLDSSSNAATITINGGATIVTKTCLYLDGSNDYLKAAAFALAQPETVYFVGSQVTWTRNDFFVDGNATNSMGLLQFDAASPKISIFAGSAVENGGLALSTSAVMTGVFNGAPSAIRVNRTSAVTGNAGAANGNGLTVGARGAGDGNYANITAQEVLVYSGAHDKATQERVIAMLARNNRIALT